MDLNDSFNPSLSILEEEFNPPVPIDDIVDRVVDKSKGMYGAEKFKGVWDETQNVISGEINNISSNLETRAVELDEVAEMVSNTKERIRTDKQRLLNIADLQQKIADKTNIITECDNFIGDFVQWKEKADKAVADFTSLQKEKKAALIEKDKALNALRTENESKINALRQSKDEEFILASHNFGLEKDELIKQLNESKQLLFEKECALLTANSEIKCLKLDLQESDVTKIESAAKTMFTSYSEMISKSSEKIRNIKAKAAETVKLAGVVSVFCNEQMVQIKKQDDNHVELLNALKESETIVDELKKQNDAIVDSMKTKFSLMTQKANTISDIRSKSLEELNNAYNKYNKYDCESSSQLEDIISDMQKIQSETENVGKRSLSDLYEDNLECSINDTESANKKRKPSKTLIGLLKKFDEEFIQNIQTELKKRGIFSDIYNRKQKDSNITEEKLKDFKAEVEKFNEKFLSDKNKYMWPKFVFEKLVVEKNTNVAISDKNYFDFLSKLDEPQKCLLKRFGAFCLKRLAKNTIAMETQEEILNLQKVN